MRCTYTVTRELRTPWYLKLLRFLRLAKKMEVYCIVFDYHHYKKGDILRYTDGGVKIVKKEIQSVFIFKSDI